MLVSGTVGIVILKLPCFPSCRLCVVYTSRPRRLQGCPLLASPAPALCCCSLVDKAYYLHCPRSQVDPPLRLSLPLDHVLSLVTSDYPGIGPSVPPPDFPALCLNAVRLRPGRSRVRPCCCSSIHAIGLSHDSLKASPPPATLPSRDRRSDRLGPFALSFLERRIRPSVCPPRVLALWLSATDDPLAR